MEVGQVRIYQLGKGGKLHNYNGHECEVLGYYPHNHTARVRFLDNFETCVAADFLVTRATAEYVAPIQKSPPGQGLPLTLADAVGLNSPTPEDRFPLRAKLHADIAATVAHLAVPHDGKDDKGKPNPALLFEGCAAALSEVSKVLDGGAKKYAADSWQRVPDGINRYKAAFYRHLQDMQVHGWDSVNEADFGLLHLDHAITDLLFIRSLMLKESNAI